MEIKQLILYLPPVFKILKMEFIHEVNHEVKYFEVDFNGELKLNYLFNYFQDIAAKHADILKFGYNDLEESNLIWILTGIKVEIIEIPKLNEKLTLRTITKGITGIYAIRNFEIYNEINKTTITAVSSWILIDKTSFRPIRIQRHPIINPIIFFENPQIKPLDKIALSEKKITGFEYRFLYGDIDINQHVNNAKYVELISNYFSLDIYKNLKFKYFQINFVHQSMFGDTIEMNVEKIENDLFKIEGLNKNSKKQLFVSKIHWEMR